MLALASARPPAMPPSPRPFHPLSDSIHPPPCIPPSLPPPTPPPCILSVVPPARTQPGNKLSTSIAAAASRGP
eukprot:360787-Chlamydomonas_euryale.AAC.1